nr:4Fe-4S dicluster domain-containing protein [uncultured Sellimonas sp.]
MPYKLKFHSQKCVGCFACHIACLDAHHSVWEEDVQSFRTIKKVSDTDRNVEYNVCPGCLHCGKCMEVCPKKALFRDEKTGFILTAHDKCNGCRKCEESCPIGVIRFDKNKKVEKCDGCIERINQGREPACVRVCPLHAISWEEE